MGLERGLLLEWLWFRRSGLEGIRVNWTFLSCFLLLLCLLLFFLFLLDVGPVQMASVWVFTTYHWRWSFPVHRIHRKVTLELYRSLAGFMRPYSGVRSHTLAYSPLQSGHERVTVVSVFEQHFRKSVRAATVSWVLLWCQFRCCCCG